MLIQISKMIKDSKLDVGMRGQTGLIVAVGALWFALSMPVQAVETRSVVANGTVPDEQTKRAILDKLQNLYGDNVVDQIQIAAVKTPPEWRQTVLESIQPELKNVSKGQLAFNGASIKLSGEVQSEALKNALSRQIGQGKSAVYQISQQLKVSVSEQRLIDQTLANRIVEFESGSTVLTLAGRQILDEMTVAMTRVGNKPVRIIGHTDSQGNLDTNLELSLQRAKAVRNYLISKGVNKMLLSTEGLGSNQPIADNATEEGRRRNRRIEFEVL
ncbi:OmpA family protein [Alkanindiges sp. WGS2144]|uniref:OmpA family protein n=1 Tax=Alkanindiges sp. WGS2144 TaxID=3366808 RepID=UPI003750A187